MTDSVTGATTAATGVLPESRLCGVVKATDLVSPVGQFEKTLTVPDVASPVGEKTLVVPSSDTFAWAGPITPWDSVLPSFLHRDGVDPRHWAMPLDDDASIRQAHTKSFTPVVCLTPSLILPSHDGIAYLHVRTLCDVTFREEANAKNLAYLRVTSVAEAFARASQLYPESWFIAFSLDPMVFYPLGIALLRRYSGEVSYRYEKKVYTERVKPKRWILWGEKTCIIPTVVLEEHREYLDVALGNLGEIWKSMGLVLD